MDEIKNIAETLCVVRGNQWLDLALWTGYDQRHIPLGLRTPDEAITHVNSFMGLVKDLACDPRSGGIAGTENIAKYFGVSPEHFRRKILSQQSWIRSVDGIPVTHVDSATAGGEFYRENVNISRRERLGLHDVSSGPV